MLDLQFVPTLILATTKGYHVYYVFDEPLFIRRRANGQLPAVKAAKAIVTTLKTHFANQLPAVDVACNCFGVFRVPRPNNIAYFKSTMTVAFQDLMTWSMNYQRTKKAQGSAYPKRTKRRTPARRQIEQPWFQALLQQRHIDQKVGYGRHNTIFTLALACYESKLSAEQCFDLLDEFNSNLYHSLATRHIQKVIADAYSGQFHGAKRQYVNALLETWVPNADKRVYWSRSQVAWYKYAKPRQERVNSHVHEWQQDLLAYFARQIFQGTTWYTQTSLRQIARDLKICLGSLTKALQQLIDQGLVYRENGSGRQGTKFATRQSLLQHVSTVQRQQRQNFWLTVAQIMGPSAQLQHLQQAQLLRTCLKSF